MMIPGKGWQLKAASRSQALPGAPLQEATTGRFESVSCGLSLRVGAQSNYLARSIGYMVSFTLTTACA